MNEIASILFQIINCFAILTFKVLSIFVDGVFFTFMGNEIILIFIKGEFKVLQKDSLLYG